LGAVQAKYQNQRSPKVKDINMRNTLYSSSSHSFYSVQRIFKKWIFLMLLTISFIFLTEASAAPTLYDALSKPPERTAGHDVDLSIYRDPGKPIYGKFNYKAPVKGLVQVNPPHGTETEWTDKFEIAWTKMGKKGPLVLFLHGVPTNRRQWENSQKYVSRFAETISIDMLGMGESSKPRMYGGKEVTSPNERWHWSQDVDYIEKLMQHYYPGPVVSGNLAQTVK